MGFVSAIEPLRVANRFRAQSYRWHIVSCTGGPAAIDMMLALIGRKHGRDLAAAVSEQFVLGRIRSQSDHQRMEIAGRYGVHNRKTIQIIKLMQEHIEDPLPADDLADMIAVTRRQLERLFSTHLHTTPSHFYTGVRLDRARELLRQTDMGVMAVGVACGFASSSHFARAYRARFGLSPKDDRSQAPVNGLPERPASSRALRTQRLQAKG